MKTSVTYIKKFAVKLLIKFFKINYDLKRQQEIIKLLELDFLQSPSYQHRIMFLYFCENCIDSFSK